jgi:peptidyl-dipeptidase A
VVPATGPIPAHLLGNMWAQSWDNLYPLLKPATGASRRRPDQALLEERKTDAKADDPLRRALLHLARHAKLPATFWERSLLTKPRDRDVVCHASAWDLDGKDDVRVKMCITPTAEDFRVIHHELGHLYYDLAYSKQSPVQERRQRRLPRSHRRHRGAVDHAGLSEAGRPDEEEPDPSQDIGPLLYTALQKVAFLPFAYMVDKWRWQVYSRQGQAGRLRQGLVGAEGAVQGVKRPGPIARRLRRRRQVPRRQRRAPYARYFLAAVLQFQFHRALCREAGDTGPLNRCSVYGNAKAGAKFQQMLELGASKPWPEALKAISGEDKIDGGALLDYFAPLKTWLDAQNAAFAAPASHSDTPGTLRCTDAPATLPGRPWSENNNEYSNS